MSGGVGTALGQALAEAGEQQAADLLAQAGLFDDLDAAEIGALDAASPLSARVAHPLADAVRAKGRPAGSRNRRTEATVRWLLSQHRHPLAVMAEIYSMTPVALAAQLGVEATDDTILELFKLQLRMAEAVAPYVAQRLPQAVTLEAHHDFTMRVEGVSFPARAALGHEIQAVDGVVLGVKSDPESRTDD